MQQSMNGAVEPVEKAKRAPMIKTTAKIDYQTRKKNIKYDASTLPASSDQNAIRRQVEFYFSDSNLPIDKFMWNKTGGSENKPIPVRLISTFSRMRRFRPYEAIVTALRESNALLVAGEKGEETIKRKVPYATEKRNNVSARSIYAKGFGDETPTTQFELEAFFTQFGPVNSVRLRRTPEMLFKGSVFVEFATQESQKKFLERDPKPIWNGHELLIMSKMAYVEDKCSQIREGKIQPSKKTLFFEGKEKFRPFERKEKHFDKNSPDRNWHKGGRSGHGGRGGRGGFRGGRRSGPDVDVASVDIAAAAIEEEEKAKKQAKPEVNIDNKASLPEEFKGIKRDGEVNAVEEDGRPTRDVDVKIVPSQDKPKGIKREHDVDSESDEPPAKKTDVKIEAPEKAV